MKLRILLSIAIFAPLLGFCQSDPHYTMFMYNKLMYNPAYTGSREVTELNLNYTDQWMGIQGAPVTINATLDGLIGSYMNPFRKVALGISFNTESIGVEKNTDIMTYYSYRIQTGNSTLSFGLSGGVKLYTANYSELTAYQSNDPNLAHNINNALLPNFGTGIYWCSAKFYAGASIPNLLENYYDKNEKVTNQQAREIRGYYVCAGYVFDAGESLKVEPQMIYRYSGDGTYHLPSNTDLNLSFIINNRLLIGGTYRTDNSMEGIVHLQVMRNFNMGFAYNYAISALNPYNSGTYEIGL